MSIANPFPTSRLYAAPLWVGQAVLFICVGIACLAGIYSRPVGYFAAFWPANAIMLGLLLRYPHWAAAWTTWLYGLLAFVLADLATGTAWALTLGMNIANVVGVLTGWLYFSRLAPSVLHLLHLRSILHLLVGCIAAALGCTALGAPVSHAFFQTPLLQTATMWASSEFASYILIIPLFLAAGQGTTWRWPRRLHDWTHVVPLLALVASETLAFMLGGPGYLGISMPAMVWCAMAYGVFPVAVLNLLTCTWKTASIALGVFSFTPEHALDVTSLRLGMALLSLAPLSVASAYALRLQALERLNYVVNHDFLTQALARRAFLERGEQMLSRLKKDGAPMAVMMLDLDLFKQINDRHGHAQGDKVLQQFAQLVQSQLRPDDIFGRLGGEEFALLLPRVTPEQALAVGQRLCGQLRQHAFALEGGASLRVTCSIGLHVQVGPWSGATLEPLLGKADAALYEAKAAGRDQVRRYFGG